MEKLIASSFFFFPIFLPPQPTLNPAVSVDVAEETPSSPASSIHVHPERKSGSDVILCSDQVHKFIRQCGSITYCRSCWAEAAAAAAADFSRLCVGFVFLAKSSLISLEARGDATVVFSGLNFDSGTW